MSSLFILLFIIAAIVLAPLLIVMLVVKLTESENKKRALEKKAEEAKLAAVKVVESVQLAGSVADDDLSNRNSELSDADGMPKDQQPTTSNGYTPNHIPAKVRIESIVLSLFLIGYGAVSWYLDEMFLPAKSGGGIVIHGLALKLMFCAMICAAFNLAAVVLDHYDQRNNERHYIIFSKVTRFLGWTLLLLALAADLFNVGN